MPESNLPPLLDFPPCYLLLLLQRLAVELDASPAVDHERPNVGVRVALRVALDLLVVLAKQGERGGLAEAALLGKGVRLA